MPQALTVWDFEGAWTWTREIDDRMGLGAGVGAGTAVFAKDAQGLIYDESGELCFAKMPPLKGTRRYIWRETSEGAEILFEDQRPFHRVVFAQLAPNAAHWCDPDQYDVSYDFSCWPDWSSQWQVRGPRKDYVMLTRYCRA